MNSSKQKKRLNSPANAAASEETKQSKRSRKKQRQAEAALAEEERLAVLLFGGSAQSHTDDVDTRSSDPIDDAGSDVEEPFTFQIDRGGTTDTEGGGNNEEARQVVSRPAKKDLLKNKKDEDDTTLKPVWIDEDDEDLKVDLLGTSRLRKLRSSRTEVDASAMTGQEVERRLRERFERTTQLTAKVDWAQPKNKEIDDVTDESDDAFQTTSEPLLLTAGGERRLPPNILGMVRCPDANQSDPNNAVVQAVNFHPGSDPERPLLITAGFDKTLRFFQVGEEKSEKIHGIHFPKLPIYSASFLGNTGNVVVSGRRPFFYIYDSIAGKLDLVPRIIGREEKSLEKCFPSPDGRTLAFLGNDGNMILFDAHSKHWIADLKINGSVRALAFTPDGKEILGSGSDGDIYRWDLRTRKCIDRFSNEDGTTTSYLAASSRNVAVGAESGVVNLYSSHGATGTAASLLNRPRKPLKSIMNLHTSADMLRFNGDGQVLALSSRREKDSLKLLHVPTATVFSNWPTSKTPLGYVWSTDFSPGSRFLAIGNDKGKCLLYKMTHYSS